MITADQLVCHAIGDYVLQSDWMALEKTTKTKACIAHVLAYVLPFLILTRSPAALAIIVGTHFVIDRWRLARYVVWAKNFLAPKHIVDHVETLPFNRREHLIMRRNYPWADCSATGYYKERPPWMAVWLLIIADNTMHVLFNGLALWWFP